MLRILLRPNLLSEPDGIPGFKVLLMALQGEIITPQSPGLPSKLEQGKL
jgi:hypothetical protein